MSVKAPEVEASQASSISTPAPTLPTNQPKDVDVDQALEFLREHGGQDDQIPSRADVANLRRRADYRIMPLLWACALLQFLDKVAYNYAAVMGLPKDLGLKGDDYTNAGTALFAAYVVAEVFTVMALQKLPAAKWLGFNVIVWGVACAAAAGAHNYATILTARIFLGIFEASISACLIAIITQWYRKDEQSIRLTWIYTGLGFGSIIGGLLSFGFQQLLPGQASLAGWRIMFITIGVITVLVGIAVVLFLPSSPMESRWLSDDEKVKLLKYLSVNRTGVQNFHFHPRQIWETAIDPQVWLLVLVGIAPSISAGIGTTYSATLLSLFGITPKRSALLTTPIGAIAIVTNLLVGFAVRYHWLSRASTFIIMSACGIIGACLLAFVPSPTPLHPKENHQNLPSLLAGIYLINCVAPALALVSSWASANIAGTTKKAIVFSLVSACFGIGNIISIQTFQARDIPTGYKPARIAVMGTQIAGMALVLSLTAYYWWQNRSRKAAAAAAEAAGHADNNTDDAASEKTSGSSTAWKGMSDHEDKNFRYSY